MKYKDGFKKGSLELLILSILSEKDCYGYEISQLLKEYSKGAIRVPEGSLYPMLYKLEGNGYITNEKRLVGKRRERVYYHIEEKGQAALSEMIDAYWQVADGISSILNRETLNGELCRAVSK